ncbi:lysozyme inhibitor LprI family protein [Butyrivibrio sp. MC2021]|uniref:lysozyme inhibitor LprI family protein n=1 Tax=Butyrivibrio sp. MC2021 TaxID=1408306 RepID=UPI0004796B5F|nr:lysozyme inhibitor LprI family protein [Butyrivibrio sp. MC2021]
MKRKIYCALAITAAFLTLAGCDKGDAEQGWSSEFEPVTETAGSQNEQQTTTEQEKTEQTAADQTTGDQTTEATQEAPADNGAVSICDETTPFDYASDYTEEIKVAVERAVAGATSFEDEFAKMQEIHEHITSRRSDDENQAEMNVVSFYYYQIWDAELNNLWDRFTQTVDDATKERVLADQRAWNVMKEDAALEALGPQEEGGSIYPLLYNSFMEDSTKVRCYFLAKEMAAAKGDSFTMPKKSVLGSYVDNQGTDSIYSCLSVTESWESGYIAKATLHGIGELEGTVEEAGDGVLSFASDDDSVKGTITYGWDGAVLEITEVNGDSVVSLGDKFEFPMVF